MEYVVGRVVKLDSIGIVAKAPALQPTPWRFTGPLHVIMDLQCSACGQQWQQTHETPDFDRRPDFVPAGTITIVCPACQHAETRALAWIRQKPET